MECRIKTFVEQNGYPAQDSAIINAAHMKTIAVLHSTRASFGNPLFPIAFFVALACFLFSGIPPAPASTVVIPSLEELVQSADSIVEGVVQGQVATWEDGTGASKAISTTVTLKISQVFKGTASDYIELRMAGGQIGDIRDVVQGSPQFENSKTYILFIQNNGKQLVPLVAMTYGQFKIVQDAQGVARLFDGKDRPVTSLDQIGRNAGSMGFPDAHPAAAAPSTGAAAIPAISFAQEIRRLVSKQKAQTK